MVSANGHRHDEEDTLVACSCCGKWVEDTEAANTDFSKVPYPHDVGFGMCKECGGDKSVKDIKSEEGVKKKMGWAMQTFCEARFDVIRKSLKPENRAKWDRCTYAKKVMVVLGFVEKGSII